MKSEGVESLTEGQRVCLRLVLVGKNSKEIARDLNISVDTVNQRVAAARRKLGAQGRFEAARILAAHEGVEPYHSLVYQPMDIAEPLSLSSDRGANPQGLAQSVEEGDRVRDNQAAYNAFEQIPIANPWRLPIPTAGRTRNDLTFKQILGWALLIALGSIVLVGAAMSLINDFWLLHLVRNTPSTK